MLMDKTIIKERVDALRSYMAEKGLSAYIVVSSDAHSSEYVADRWKAREWLTGFDGSAGTAVITADDARLWTDSRYWIAAESALDSTRITLMKDGERGTLSISQWLCANVEQGGVVGADGTVCSIAETIEWGEALSAAGLSLDTSHDAIDAIWENRPAVPNGAVEVMPLHLCGESSADKIARLRVALASKGVQGILLTMLDEIAWLANIRGCDVDYNPVVVSYMLVTAESATLYVLPEKLSQEVVEHLSQAGIAVAHYDDVWGALAAYPCETILLQPNRCNRAVLEQLNASCEPCFQNSPVAEMKAVKNAVEIEGFEKAMLAEGVAMVKLLHWLKGAVNGEQLTELDIDRKLTELRSEDAAFKGLSFATIAAYGENAAIVHYEPTEATNAALQPKGLLLLDCGAQYECGTTDVTRTIPLGEISDEERRDYTLVLRGHISLAMAKFPVGTCGTQLDVLARQWLWQQGENYLHGTGHGVGHYLNVHEGPHQIRMNNMPAPLLPGVTVTNEPGLYKAGRHGIRIENTMLVEHSLTTEFGDFCSMRPLTLCPIDTTAIVPELLGADAIAYLNEYHAMVYEKLSPFFDGELLLYLKGLCKSI